MRGRSTSQILRLMKYKRTVSSAKETSRVRQSQLIEIRPNKSGQKCLLEVLLVAPPNQLTTKKRARTSGAKKPRRSTQSRFNLKKGPRTRLRFISRRYRETWTKGVPATTQRKSKSSVEVGLEVRRVTGPPKTSGGIPFRPLKCKQKITTPQGRAYEFRSQVLAKAQARGSSAAGTSIFRRSWPQLRAFYPAQEHKWVTEQVLLQRLATV